MNDFNRIAGIYDPIKNLVFGDKLDNASIHFLDRIQEGERVLILGGGSGKILKSITSNAQITYVERSQVMIRYAKQNAKEGVVFVCDDFMEFDSSVKFDWVVCPYLLDVFGLENLKLAVRKIHDLLEPDGKLMVTDFQKGAWYQNLFVRFMYLFFGWTTNIETKSLNNIHQVITEKGFFEKELHFFVNRMVFSRVYRK
ncbi:MAG: class I SAM-dependent methyltransferase [Cyclobacteriaceae bacterium]